MLHLHVSEEDLNKVFERNAGLVICTFKVVDFRLVVNIEKEAKGVITHHTE